MGVVAAVALAGCESIYAAPKSGPTAQVIVKNTRLAEAQQAKVMHLGGDRSRRDWIGDGIFYEYDKRWTVAAGARTFFEIEALIYAGTYTELYCSVVYSFTPEAGRTHVFTPEMPGRGCSTAITDEASGAPPPDLRQEMASAG